jgi:hypothetical protein
MEDTTKSRFLAERTQIPNARLLALENFTLKRCGTDDPPIPIRRDRLGGPNLQMRR